MTQESSRRLAAVWFAKIVGFTELSARDEDSALSVLRELRRIARTQCDSRNGRVVKLLGDSVLTVFDSADGAVRAAVALRDHFLQTREVRETGVSLRVGLHLGDVAEGEDGEVHGDAVSAASRIEGTAEAGQVVISGVAYQLLQQRSTLEVEDLGEHDLEGLGPVQLYAASMTQEEEIVDLKGLLQEELAPLQVLDVAGLGGMGEIYLARDPRLRRTRAVKVLRTELVADKQARARFIREAQVIAGLSHPNVITIHSVGELEDGTPYFVMDFVESGSLTDRLEREGTLSVREARRIVGEVASALTAAHAKGVVHRDIKASNVLFDAESGRVLVTDWGIAALDPTVELSPETRLTKTGSVIGSPRYMSPEQLAGDEVGPETDVYSLGLLAYELLTGSGPFDAETPRALMVAHLREDAPPLSELREDVDPEFDSIIARCLSKSPRDRVTAEDLAGRFAPGAGSVLEWPPPGLEPLRGSIFKLQVAWVMLGMCIALPILLAFAARIPWGLEGVFRDMLQGELGEVVLLGVILGLTGAVAAVALIAERQHVVVRAGEKAKIQADPRMTAFDLGYGWRTLLETALDRWGDFGNILSGQREYAVLDAQERARVRRRTLRRGALLSGIVFLLPFCFILAATAVSLQWMSVAMSLLLFIALPGALWLLAYILPTDTHTVKLARMELAAGPRSRSVGTSEVVAWKEARRRATPGLPQDVSRPPGRRSYWAVQLAQIIVLMVPYGYLFAAMVSVVMVGRGYSLPGLTEGERFTRITQAAHLRLPPDATVTPQAARALMDSIASWNVEEEAWLGDPPALQDIHGSSLANPTMPYGLAPQRVVASALNGLSSQERSYLERFGGDPRLPWLDRLAVASGLEAMMVSGYPDDMLFRDYADLVRPVVRRLYPQILQAARSKVAVAGHLLDAGRIEEAEQALRAVFSVGLLIAEGSNEIMGATLGRNVAILGVDALEQMYLGTERYDVLASLGEVAPRPTVGASWKDWLERAGNLVADSTVVRSVRLATMHDLVVAFECTSVEGVLLGLDGRLRDQITDAAESLVRFPSDEPFVDMATTSHARLQRRVAQASTEELQQITDLDDVLAYRLLRLVGRLVGNPRFAGCPVEIVR